MAMQLTHDFTVPASLEDTWAAFNDIEGVAGCFPGATVTDAQGDSFEGTCKVKLGPIALVYKGAGAFVEKDRDAGRMKIEAKGKDKRGNGTAGADVTATMVEHAGGTRVTVVTDLNITGKPAQFGRGVMQDVSDKLLAQFVDCLSQRLSEPEAEDNAAAAGDQDAGAASQPTGAAAGTPPGDATGDPDAGPASAPTADAVPLRPAPTRPAPSRPKADDDALDLGATVLPVLAKAYWRQAVGVLAGLVLLRALLRRRRS
ncbi:MAG: SRPBCC domain-containing protein [Marmoricola sp.]